MDGVQNVRLYQDDYDKLNKIAKDNGVSMAVVISQLITEYERLMSQPQPQVIFQQMHMGEPVNQGGNENA